MDRTLEQMLSFNNFIANVTVWLQSSVFSLPVSKNGSEICVFISLELMYGFPYRVETNGNISETVVWMLT